MKIIVLLSLLTLFLSPAFAATAVKLACSLRKNVIVSSFNYGLTTMKWGKHFQVAAGSKKTHTDSGTPFRITSFRNGDDLVYFPGSDSYLFFYAGGTIPDRCSVLETFSYPVTPLSRYKKPLS
ncbi:hypothetical protein HQN64_10845 [Enterobacteriaceae bacterium BIT-l23]|jgi:hypothetical protein|uniref:hypothetical protein n=1 Tax=Jejubacter sp. L23 TaxID=3092086 RepID=UPI001584EDB8|nr:hypothetical protein [Enterobacteriaceae bacterium BIT-l23]